MNFEIVEHAYYCPYCNADVSILVDPSLAQQEFVEDCEVCCNPIDFSVRTANAMVIDFEARRLDD